MPSFIINIIINIFLKIGLPALMEWLRKRFPWIPQAQVMQVLADYSEEKKAAIGQVKKRARKRLRDCIGASCVPDTVGEN